MLGMNQFLQQTAPATKAAPAANAPSTHRLLLRPLLCKLACSALQVVNKQLVPMNTVVSLIRECQATADM